MRHFHAVPAPPFGCRLAVACAAACLALAVAPAAALSVDHYASPSGSDAADGTTPATAWRTLGRATSAVLPPGSRLLLERGGTWSGETLRIAESGVTVGAYGDTALPVPVLTNTPDTAYNAACLVIEGSDNRVSDLSLWSCSASGARAGLVVRGDRNLVEDMHIGDNEAGVVLTTGADFNRFYGNHLDHNDRMTVNTPGGGGDDYGAYSFSNEGGNDNEFAENRIEGGRAPSYDYGLDGSGLEVYGGQRLRFHHNFLDANEASIEVAGGQDVLVAYNRMSDLIVLHMKGRAGNSDRIRLYNNTAVLPSDSQGFYVGRGGRTTGVTLRNNIIKVTPPQAAGYAESTVDSDYNIYTGPAHGKWKFGPHDLLTDPLLTSDWHLMPGSPAINSGTATVFDYDLEHDPLVGAPDRGTYEYGG